MYQIARQLSSRVFCVDVIGRFFMLVAMHRGTQGITLIYRFAALRDRDSALAINERAS